MQSITEKVQFVVSFNNKGTEFLINGNIEKALKCFNTTRSIISNIFLEVEEVSMKGPPSLVFDADKYCLCYSSMDVPNLVCDDFHIYGKAIFIIPGRYEDENLSQMLLLLSCYYSIVLFNKGIAYHVRYATVSAGISDTAKLLVPAAQHYNKCVDWIESLKLENSDYMRMLVIMSLNNAAQISYSLNEFQQASSILDTLSRSLENLQEYPFAEDNIDLTPTKLNLYMYSCLVNGAPCA